MCSPTVVSFVDSLLVMLSEPVSVIVVSPPLNRRSPFRFHFKATVALIDREEVEAAQEREKLLYGSKSTITTVLLSSTSSIVGPVE